MTLNTLNGFPWFIIAYKATFFCRKIFNAAIRIECNFDNVMYSLPRVERLQQEIVTISEFSRREILPLWNFNYPNKFSCVFAR